jgi:hypothetical protein
VKGGYLKEGQVLYFGQHSNCKAIVSEDGSIQSGDVNGSIHKVGKLMMKAPCNGWTAWYYIDEKTGNREPIDTLRKIMRNETRTDGNSVIENRENR